MRWSGFFFSWFRSGEMEWNQMNQRQQSSPNKERLLYSREQVAELLGGISTATVRRLEREGRLRPIRLTGRNSGQVFFKATDVRTLIEEVAYER
jgi:hypothetical protein